MEETFNYFLGEVETAMDIEEPTLDESSDLESNAGETDPIDTVDNTVVDTTVEEPVINDVVETVEKQDFSAFADMRVKNKELQQEKDKLEAERQAFEDLALTLGFKDSKEMLEAKDKKKIEEEAKASNVPVEFLQRLKALEAKDAVNEQERLSRELEIKQDRLINSIDCFRADNTLTEDAVKKTIENLGNDGFDFETLVNLPEKSITKLLNSYVDREIIKQKELETEAIKSKEIPLTPTDINENLDTDAENIFNMFIGKE